MAEDQRQSMQDEIDRRDEVIARQSAEIALLKQAVDALTRRIFGAKSESLDPSWNCSSIRTRQKKRPPSLRKAPDRRLKGTIGPGAARSRGSRASRSTCR